MFRGILPSKRISSSEFTMITPLGDANGKENHPASGPPLLAKSFRPPMSKPKSEKRKNNQAKAEEPQAEVFMTDKAFDKLLVSGIQISDDISWLTTFF
jgi:hypothetical protein